MADNFHHLGVLVSSVDVGRDRWAAVTGWTFSPVTRYRCEQWRDRSNLEPHLHDARLSFSFEGPPYIEMLEHLGSGTHSAQHGEGGHHLAFPSIDDNVVRTAELERLGVGIDGENIQDGRPILMFTERSALNDLHIEYVEDGHVHPNLKDDGTPVNVLPDGTTTLFDVDTVLRLRYQPSRSPVIDEIAVWAYDLEESARRWQEIVGYSFGPAVTVDNETFMRSDEGPPRIRLTQSDSPQTRGLAYIAFLWTQDLALRKKELTALQLRTMNEARDSRGRLKQFTTRPEDFNGVSLRFETALDPNAPNLRTSA